MGTESRAPTAEQIKRELAAMDEPTALRQMAVILGHWGVKLESYTPGDVCGAVFTMQRELLELAVQKREMAEALKALVDCFDSDGLNEDRFSAALLERAEAALAKAGQL